MTRRTTTLVPPTDPQPDPTRVDDETPFLWERRDDPPADDAAPTGEAGAAGAGAERADEPLTVQAIQTRRIDGWLQIGVAGLAAIFLLVVGRVAQLKIAPDARLAAAAGARESVRPEAGRRGELLDRRGRVVATTTTGLRLFIDPGVVEDIDTIAIDLAGPLAADPVELDKRIQKGLDRRYVVLRDLLTDDQAARIRELDIRGVGLEPRPVRHYPHEDVGRQLIGLVGVDHTGLGGMEYVFENDLEAEDGRLSYLRDVRRRALWIDRRNVAPASDGESVRLSIDMVVQAYAEDRLREQVESFNAAGGRLIVMDSRSGELLAVADLLRDRPGLEPYATDPRRAIDPSLGRNRCATDPYEPGSTFKPFVWAAATEMGKADPEEILPTPDGSTGAYRTSQGRSIRDTFYYEDSSWRKVLVKSQNSGMAMVAERMTHRELHDAIRRFGFGQDTNAGVPGETAGILTPLRKWSHHTQTSTPMGHEIAVTPLQMVRAFSAFARDGTLATPRITAARRGETRAPFIFRALDAATARLTREVMRDVMTDGTGRPCQSTRYRMFGKSGTPQLVKHGGGGYYEDRYTPSFIAGAPLETPRVVVLCLIEDPMDQTAGHTGGRVAGPVVRDVIDFTLDYLGAAPDAEPALAAAVDR